MMQGVLFSAVRNCDGISPNGPNKIVVRGIRELVIKSAQFVGSFNGCKPTCGELQEAMNEFIKEHDCYPTHFVSHIMHAAEVIGYMYPWPSSRELWYNFYVELCSMLHLQGESMISMVGRLKDDPESVRVENEEDEKAMELQC